MSGGTTKKKIGKQTPSSIGSKIKLPDDFLDLINYHDFAPAFLFSSVQKNFCLSSWDKGRIKILIEKLSLLESKKWNDILCSRILEFKQVDKTGLKVSTPPEVTDDTTIFYFQPCGSKNSHRVFGYRERHNFRFLWFDKNHEVYPGKYK